MGEVEGELPSVSFIASLVPPLIQVVSGIDMAFAEVNAAGGVRARRARLCSGHL